MNIRRKGPSRGQVRAAAYLTAALLVGSVFLWQTLSMARTVRRSCAYLCSAMDMVFCEA